MLDEHLIGDEEKLLVVGLTAAKKFSTTMMLGLRPVLFVKEYTIGVLRNFSAAALGLDPDITVADMSKAYFRIMTVDNQMSDDFNLIDRLNQEYGMANMDISSMPKKVQSDRWGMFKGMGRIMFMTSTKGDYYNRLAILVAKMEHEGSLEAHSLDKDGALVYDAFKDKRFSRYLAERHLNKDAEGNYIAKEGDVEYNTQRRYYLATIEQMNTEGTVTNEEKLTEESIIKTAHTIQERDSVKGSADLMYGSYDKETQFHFGNGLVGLALMQFLTFWPNKVRFWFGKRIEAEDSPMGKRVQMTQKGPNGPELL